MKKVNIKDAIGLAICHDMSQITPGEFKGVRFAKGHVVKEEDIEVLLSMGKEHIYIWEEDENYVHESDAAEFMANLLINDNMEISDVKEGKINFISKCDGVLKINVELVNKINSIGEIALVTKLTNTVVKKGEVIAGTRIIPLRIEKEQLEEFSSLVKDENVISIKEINNNLKVGIVTTGSEIFYGRIKDKFGDVLNKKLGDFGIKEIKQIFAPDDMEEIKEKIKSFESEYDIILCTGGMSVDPDDITPTAIKESGWEIVTYGTPVLPGSMFLLAYKGDKVIMGLPGGVIFCDKTVFDLILPRVLAGDKITRKDIQEMGHGGLLN